MVAAYRYSYPASGEAYLPCLVLFNALLLGSDLLRGPSNVLPHGLSSPGPDIYRYPPPTVTMHLNRGSGTGKTLLHWVPRPGTQELARPYPLNALLTQRCHFEPSNLFEYR